MINVLTFVQYYLPGYTSGGPIRTIANLVDQLGEEFNFKIITRHTDPRDPRPYKDVQVGAFQRVGKAEVFYASPEHLSWQGMQRLLCETEHDVLYLNSFFAPVFTIRPLMLRKLGLIPKGPVIVASRGEFSPGALAIKSFKKRAYIALAKALELYEDVVWQASSSYEEADIRIWFGRHSPVRSAPNLPEQVSTVEINPASYAKEAGRLKVLFLSRIARKKNLDGALRILQGVEEQITFDIYGPLEDDAYWSKCQRLIAGLPSNIVVQYKGALPHDRVRLAMAAYDLFFFPTHGENYGHVIQEALSAGCPVLISDQTPWRHLEQKMVGWDVPLANIPRFRSILRRCVAMDADAYASWARAAQAFAAACMMDREAVEQNRELFRQVADNRVPPML